ncbi:dolichyl-phosphate beta-glucosyltransferase [Agrilus planipennis]|uniref:Dolichyl-phosphate beta-glucosyltransferase n=1 Tax=Agrilus planipennis TaxID=224129 RepID=A0A1W4WHF5_AGRPL|nr:dolichyl-phosphate beta-glucosyltransferase [Agrilus planipennis]
MMWNLQLILFYGTACCFSILLAVIVLMLAVCKPYPIVYRSRKEKCFINPVNSESILFPSIHDQPSVHLSVIIPAYNEEDRLGLMLDECLEFLELRSKSGTFKYEIIVVSDGSKDKTVQVANEYCKKLGIDKFRTLELEKNRGKGGAVRLGVQSARGAVILFADADGATKFCDLAKLEDSLESLIQGNYLNDYRSVSSKMAIVVGSRAHLEKEAVATRSLFRVVLMYGFHFLVWLFAVRGIRDTQCGFKLFTREAARICFENLHIERWAFDVELLKIAEYLKIPINEVAVNWTEIDGSKVTPVLSWIEMGLDLALIWIRYFVGAWKIKTQEDLNKTQ